MHPAFGDIEEIHRGYSTRRKDQDKARVFYRILSFPRSTRTQIADACDLRPNTVSSAVHELVEDGLVVESEAPARRRGRPRVALTVDGDRLTAQAVYVASQELRAATVNIRGEVRPGSRFALAEDSPRRAIAAAIRRLLARGPRDDPQTRSSAGISFVLPGTIDADRLRWKKVSRWPFVKDIDLTTLVAGETPAVSVTKSLAAQLEYLVNTSPGYQSGGVVLVHWGWGIGAAYSIDGVVQAPTGGGYGEIGHWHVGGDEKAVCVCGDRGCLETQAALWSLRTKLESSYGPVDPDETVFSEQFRRGEMRRHRAVMGATHAVALALRNLAYTWYPRRILLIGPFTEDPGLVGVLAEDPALSNLSFGIEAVRIPESAQALVGSARVLMPALRPLLRARWD